ncbi:hypothetical protein [Neorhizobium sp. T25_13]|uniref:hypothetical protein n=1 Tax=Neorhizobium sp. T25_13 TaxID=2093830 RepID=UPI00155F0FDA|nr:hypothetical protein [Neorhizobium sp. T25_13]
MAGAMTLSGESISIHRGIPKSKIDISGVFGQFLSDLSLNDLVVELVQNDLDAGAKRTVISFDTSKISAEGDGAAIDGGGWARLEYLLGAGGEVEAKKDGIGSKNHGLRALFLLGDEIVVQSDGSQVSLTVRGNLDRPGHFHPATWDRVDDVAAPAQGTRITTAYRTEKLKKPDGDSSFLTPPSVEELDALWQEAVREAPDRFITSSSPGKPWKYELCLSREGQDPVTFTYECRPLNGAFKGVFLRTCKRKVGEGPSEIVSRRHCISFPIDNDMLGAGKIPRLFRLGRRVYGEVSWGVTRSNRPIPALGLLRYPIAFPPDTALSGAGFDISGPFIAGRARHALSEDPRNARIVDAGRRVFAIAAGRHLAAKYGPALGDLATSNERVDGTRADEMARWLFEHGGLSKGIYNAGSRLVGAKSTKAGARLTIAASSLSAGRPDDKLSALASRFRDVLHPATPVDLASRVARVCKDEIDVFDEVVAANLVFIDGEVGRPSAPISLYKAALEVLDRLRRADSLPKDLVSDLRQRGKLPASDGKLHLWSDIRRDLEGGVPAVPGIQEPKILNEALSREPILTTSQLKLPAFNIDELLRKRNFHPVIPAGRQRFFDWLRTNARVVKSARIKEIAGYPIWPGIDGVHRKLDDYCRPSNRRLSTILKDVCQEPSKEVMALVTSKAAKSVLKFRTRPSDEEFAAWYRLLAGKVEKHLEDGDLDSCRGDLMRLEQDLETIRTKLAIAVDRLASGHHTLAQDDQLRPISSLHAATSIVSECALLPEALCQTKYIDLYRALGARTRPLPEALVAALRADPSRSKLFIRLEEYKSGGNDLADLGSEKIIRVGLGLHAAEELAFKSEPDLWGRWKTKIDRISDVPSHNTLLAALGVITGSLKSGDSSEFFRWLGAQAAAVQREHLPQILRHWRDHSRGPANWAETMRSVPCVPVRSGGQQFELLTVDEAVSYRRSVFLDDFVELREAVIKDKKLRLAIDTTGSQPSVLAAFESVGIRSLRQAAGQPIAISIRGQQPLPTHLRTELQRLQSPSVSSGMKAKLPRFGVALGDVKHDIKNLIRGINGVSIGNSLTATYSVAGSRFAVSVQSAVDPASGLVYLTAETDPVIGFYSALAGHVFKPGTSPQNAWGLLNAARDRRAIAEPEFYDDDEDGAMDPDASQGGETPANGEPRPGHGVNKSEITPKVPSPKPFTPITTITRARGSRFRHSPSRRSATDERRNSLEEQEQIRALKDEHYVWHCQACLGTHDVLKVAPPGTYIYSPGYRKRLIEAHHVQHLQNAGDLGARNLLILCHFHHDLLGDDLSRDSISAALLVAESVSRAFPKDRSGKEVERRKGLLASVTLTTEPFSAKLFFTAEHANAWKTK